MVWPDFFDDAGSSLHQGLPLEGTLRARMYVVEPEMKELHRCRIRTGTNFFCVEGPRKVARGTVTKLTGLAGAPSSQKGEPDA